MLTKKEVDARVLSLFLYENMFEVFPIKQDEENWNDSIKSSYSLLKAGIEEVHESVLAVYVRKSDRVKTKEGIRSNTHRVIEAHFAQYWRRDYLESVMEKINEASLNHRELDDGTVYYINEIIGVYQELRRIRPFIAGNKFLREKFEKLQRFIDENYAFLTDNIKLNPHEVDMWVDGLNDIIGEIKDIYGLKDDADISNHPESVILDEEELKRINFLKWELHNLLVEFDHAHLIELFLYQYDSEKEQKQHDIWAGTSKVFVENAAYFLYANLQYLMYFLVALKEEFNELPDGDVITIEEEGAAFISQNGLKLIFTLLIQELGKVGFSTDIEVLALKPLEILKRRMPVHLREELESVGWFD